ncbi:MAG: hypothetical protein K2X50_06980 [Gammaproteobacteria bacterium]|nr:hypothetical protein [Gammaproteobacteria bacterium]
MSKFRNNKHDDSITKLNIGGIEESGEGWCAPIDENGNTVLNKAKKIPYDDALPKDHVWINVNDVPIDIREKFSNNPT